MGGLESYFSDPALIWFAVGLVFLLAELFAPGLVILFFGIGAWVVAAICLVNDISINAQLVIFIISSTIALVLLRNRFKTVFMGHTSSVQNPNQDLDDFIGKHVVVKEAINLNKRGKVEFNGTLWNAEAAQEIAIGENVEIVSRENLLLKVKRI